MSPILSLPRELRNAIFKYVFGDNTTWSREIVNCVYDKGGIYATKANVPARIRLNQAEPPSVEAILPCRQLYAEMKDMHAAAFCRYWSNNRFVYPKLESPPPVLGRRIKLKQIIVPKATLLKHIRHFTFPQHGSILDVVFQDGRWHPRILPTTAEGERLNCGLLKNLIYLLDEVDTCIQCTIKKHIGSMSSELSCCPLDPGKGQGMTQTVIHDLVSEVSMHLYILLFDFSPQATSAEALPMTIIDQ